MSLSVATLIPVDLGSKVHHVTKTTDHDNFTGLVCEVTTTRRLDGATTVDYWVRWIKPDGSPSDGLTRHALSELITSPD